MFLTSLDPRINRLGIPDAWPDMPQKSSLDQLVTFEVFLQKRENVPFSYVGPVHAPDLEVAFLFAKEQYSRRASCLGLWVVNTQDIALTPYTNDTESVWQLLADASPAPDGEATQAFEIFILRKRGKAHTHAGTVLAPDYEKALAQAKTELHHQAPGVNVWVVPASKIFKSSTADNEMWLTLTDKKYREPVAYKVLDKINAFKMERANKP